MTETKCDESVSGEMNGRAGGWKWGGSGKSHAGKCGRFKIMAGWRNKVRVEIDRGLVCNHQK